MNQHFLELTAAEVAHIKEFIEEIDALIDADDGTCFGCKHIDQLALIKEIMGYIPNEESLEDED